MVTEVKCNPFYVDTMTPEKNLKASVKAETMGGGRRNSINLPDETLDSK